jgi:DNA-binding CsgD family transcriptional regulator
LLESSVNSAQLTITGSDSPFVGRAAELDALGRSMSGARSGTGRIIAVAGDAGVGKSRLLAEVAAAASARGHRVLWSQMLEEPGARPYFPWLLALRSCFQQSDDADLIREIGSGGSDLADIVPELRDRLAFDRNPRSPDGRAARYRLFDSVARYLLAVASDRALVLLLDNLHSADRSSLSLLEYFCQQIANSPILVVVAYRDSELGRGHPLRTTLNTLSRTAGFQPMSLAGLSCEEIAQLLHTHAGYSLPPPFVDAVYKKSDGNPLFVTEVGRLLMRLAPDVQMTGAGFPFKVPDTLREVIVARLEALPDATCELLGLAAVLGREFELRVLAELARIRVERAARILQFAESAGIIRLCGLGRYMFNHALFREALYAEHSTVARVKLHRRAGEQIEIRHVDDLESHISELAYHFFEAAQVGGSAKAVQYCRRAGDAAMSQRAYGDAVSLFDRALQAAEVESRPAPDQRFDLLRALGQAQYQAGQLNAATQTLLKAAIVAYRKRWWERLADTLFLFQLVCQQSGYRHVASIPLHEAVLENFGDTDEGLRARVLASLAKACRTAGQPERAVDLFQQSIAIARRSGDSGLLLDCLKKGNWTVGRDPATVRAGLEISREGLALARSLGHVDATLDCIVDIVFQLCDLGEIDDVQHQLAELRQLANCERQPHFANLLNGFEAAVAILRGHWHDALEYAREGIRQLPLQGVFGLRGRFGFQIFAIRKAQGTLGQLREVADRIIAASAIGNSQLWLPGQILLHCELEQPKHARQVFRQLGDLESLPRDDLYEVALVYLAEASAMLRDRARSAVLYELLLPYRGLNVTLPGTVMLGAASGYLAKLAVVVHRFDEAATLFEEALILNTSMEANPALASAQVDYARMLLMGRREQDNARARELLASAQNISMQHGLRPLLKAIEVLSTLAGSGALTSRETDVLKLISTGYPNGRISQRLHISHSTVATHIRNIFRKTGVTNRTQAADFARRSGLLD